MSVSAIDLNPLITLNAAAKVLGFDTNMEQETTLLCSLGNKSVNFTAVKKHSSCNLYESKFSLSFLVKGERMQSWRNCYDPPVYVLVEIKEDKNYPEIESIVSEIEFSLKAQNLYPIMPELVDDEIDYALFHLGFEREITHCLYPKAFCMKNFYPDESFDFLRVFKNDKSVLLSKNNSKETHFAYFKFESFEMGGFSIENIKKIAQELGFGLN